MKFLKSSTCFLRRGIEWATVMKIFFTELTQLEHSKYVSKYLDTSIFTIQDIDER